MQKSGETVAFIYNENGLRVQKTATSTGVTKYTLHGKNVVHMTQGSNELHFFYDAQNKPAVVVYNGTPYTYVKNLQGDIVAILDSNGIAVVQYRYDAWGRQIGCDVEAGNSNAAALSTLNPFRYRGYVYDEETGFYYLKSRYYNTEIHRFCNVDALFDSLNLYEYCQNSPIIRADENGTASVTNVKDEVDDEHHDCPSPGGFSAGDAFINGCSANVGDGDKKKRTKNPNGKKGSPQHQDTVSNAANTMSQHDANMTQGEQFVSTPDGLKSTHWGDRGILNSQGELVGVLQVGRTNTNGTPVAREMRAIYDFHTEGLFVVYVPYDISPTIYMIFVP